MLVGCKARQDGSFQKEKDLICRGREKSLFNSGIENKRCEAIPVLVEMQFGEVDKIKG